MLAVCVCVALSLYGVLRGDGVTPHPLDAVGKEKQGRNTRSARLTQVGKPSSYEIGQTQGRKTVFVQDRPDSYNSFESLVLTQIGLPMRKADQYN